MIAFFDIADKKGEVLLFDDKSYGLIGRTPLTLEDDLKVKPETVVQSKGIKDCFLSLPAGMLNFRVLELPIAGMDKIRDVLPFELEGLILGEPGDYVIDCVALNDKRVLAVCIQKSVLSKLLNGLSMLGFEPRVITSIDVSHAVRNAAAGELSGALLEGVVGGDERLALSVAEIRQITLNLRRGEFLWRKEAEQTRRFLKFSAASLIAVFLFTTADFAVKTAYIKKEGARLENAAFGIYGSLFPGGKPQSAEDALIRMKAHLKEASDKDSLLAGLRPLDTLLRLQDAASPAVKAQDITMDRETIVLKGEASALGDVEQVKQRLSRSMSSVNISETGQSARGKVSFTITAKDSR